MGWVGNDPGWPSGVAIPPGDPVEEALEYLVAYPDGATEPLPLAERVVVIELLQQRDRLTLP
jgi:hypothetical protein